MEWNRLDLLTKAAVVATATAVLTVLIPPIAVVMAVVAAALSTLGVVRSRRHDGRNPTALRCLVVSVGLVAVMVVGNVIYAAGA